MGKRRMTKDATKADNNRRLRRARELGCLPEAVPNMTGRHSEGHRGKRNPRWNDGPMISSHGYVLVRVPPNHPHGFNRRDTFAYCYEHIKVMVEHLGRSLEPGEVVHHRNDDKTDNGFANLELVQSSLHMSRHMAAIAKRRQRDTEAKA